MTARSVPILATAAGLTHRWMDELTRRLGRASLIDWILVVTAVAIATWAWMCAIAPARQGSIEVTDLVTDDAKLGPAAVRAALQRELGQRGWMPASSVPGGAPATLKLADAFAKAPVAQLSWIGTVIAALPLPPASTKFRVSGTIYATTIHSTPRSAGGGRALVLAYELVCLGPNKSITIGECTGASWPDVVALASKNVYLQIGRQAPQIYPVWARWSKAGALTSYRVGLEAEGLAKKAPPEKLVASFQVALDCYRDAGKVDPDNVLAQLRAANCLERMADADAAAPRTDLSVEALEAYARIIRDDSKKVFQAGFRASLLLTRLARSRDDLGPFADRLRSVLDDLGVSHPQDLCERLERAARIQSKLARRRLRPFWTIMHEGGRLRHRFEPTGRERRQFRKALGISRRCLRERQMVRRERNAAWLAATRAFSICYIYLRYLALRPNVAGWQAHYNAACYYALVLEDVAWQPGQSILCKRAIRRLRTAANHADGGLSCTYAQSDTDLTALRNAAGDAFDSALRAICR